MDLNESDRDAITDCLMRHAALQHLVINEIVREDIMESVEQYLDRKEMFEDSEYANKLVEKLLQSHSERIRIETRLTLDQFKSLALWLKENSKLTSSKHATLETKLCIFLYICAHGVSFRAAGNRYEVAWSQISKFFHQVLDGLVLLCKENIVLQEEDVPVPARIRYDPKMWPFFKDCIGAIDGTLIFASIKGKDRERDGGEGAYRCRKGFLAQNVLGCVDFDMNFRFVYPGWEGSAHDATVFNDAIGKGEFHTPAGRYWLADAGYCQSGGYGGQVLSPYIGPRYHLVEWKKGKLRPQTKEELFNLRHSQLRNVVERVYGVFKIRFQIFQSARDGLSLATQVKLVYALSAVHNWINSHGGSPQKEWRNFKASQNAKDRELYDKIMEQLAASSQNSRPSTTRASTGLMDARRDKIAEDMWKSYNEYLAQRDKDTSSESSDSE